MAERKTLQELTIKDNFMFGTVMMDEEICRELLELVLGFRIAKMTVSKEKYRGTVKFLKYVKAGLKVSSEDFYYKIYSLIAWPIRTISLPPVNSNMIFPTLLKYSSSSLSISRIPEVSIENNCILE